MTRIAMVAALLVCACSGGEDTATTTPPPEVAGSYNILIDGSAGCDGDETWVTGWALGPLVITGTAGTLSFDFGDPMIFAGGVDGNGKYSFSGTATYDDAVLEVSNVGSFSLTDFEMAGDFEVVVDDDEFSTNNCTITAPMRGFYLGTQD